MSSISPSSSASNEASPSGVSCFDVVACFARIEAMAEKGILSTQEAANLAKQVFPAYHAALRRASGSEQGSIVSGDSRVSRSSSGGRASNVSASRYSRISGMKSWRTPIASSAKPGYCYTQALSEASRGEVQDRLGSYPSVYSLIGLDISKFRPLSELESLRLSGNSQTAHLSSQGDRPFLAEMAAIAENSVPALDSASTLWHALRDMKGASELKFQGTTVVGSDLTEVRVHGSVVPVCVRDLRVDFAGSLPPLTSLVVVVSEQSRQRFLSSLSSYASRYDVRLIDEINGLQLSDVWFVKYQRDAVGARQWAILLGAGVRKLVCSVPPGDVVGQQLVRTAVGIRPQFTGLTSIGAMPLAVWLKEDSGIEGGIELPEDVLQLVSKSAALLDEGGKRRLRSLEAVGDSALTAVLALDNYLQGGSAQRFQDLRSHVTNNRVLSQCFCDYLPVDSVGFVGGVSPAVGVVGAKALESILGAVWIHCGTSVLARVVQRLQLVDFELKVQV